uniref:Ovule protein n=1 Tax=Heterorhabditis bacteriophora TaxID=37862 RepID=A0A1I7WTB1_HETBA
MTSLCQSRDNHSNNIAQSICTPTTTFGSKFAASMKEDSISSEWKNHGAVEDTISRINVNN